MVAQNPLFVGWSLKKFKATVVNDIWPEVLFFSLVAASECATPSPWRLRFELTYGPSPSPPAHSGVPRV